MKRDGEPTGKLDSKGQWDLIIELPQDLGNRLSEGTNKTLCVPGSRRKRLTQTCLWVLGVSGGGLSPQWPDLGQGYWLQKSWEFMAYWYKCFWKRFHCWHLPPQETLRHSKAGLSQSLWRPGFPVLHYFCPLSQWCHPTISSSVIPFSSCPQSSPASESFPVSQLFASSCQSIGASASALALPMNIQCWFPLGLTGLISLLPKGLSRIVSSVPGQRWIQVFPKQGTISRIKKLRSPRV